MFCKLKTVKTLLIALTFALAILEAPLNYYCGFLLFIPYVFTGLVLTALLFSVLKRDKHSTKQEYGWLTAMVLIGIGGWVYGIKLVEFVDWKTRFNERNRIVQQVEKGMLKPDAGGDGVTCKLSINYFPDISQGGDEILIYNDTNGVSVEFFIDRGFIGEYSAFRYTNDEKEIATTDSMIASGNTQYTKKLAANWYRVSY